MRIYCNKKKFRFVFRKNVIQFNDGKYDIPKGEENHFLKLFTSIDPKVAGLYGPDGKQINGKKKDEKKEQTKKPKTKK